MAQLTAKYNAGPSRIVSEHTVGYGATQKTSHSCTFADQASSPTAPALAPGTLRLVHGLVGESCLLLPQCTVGHTQAGSGGIMLWGMFSWVTLGPVVVVEQTMNATGYLKIIADQLHPYMAYVFPAGNGMFQMDNAPCQKSEIVLEWFQENDAEFQLMSWPPNSSDINPIEYIWDVMGRQLRVQRPPIRNMTDLCDRCLNIWYNLSPAIYQGLVASMPRRVEAVLYAKGEPTRY
ncbi:transposable element Tcb2 transposase [Trichonephila clavipes]|nr:transposable element Tcb2 transposase [Trichonephila clavipes]